MMMKQKLNVFLMIMIVLILIGLIGITVYFQNTIANANEKFNIKSEQLELTKQELQYQINQFNKLNTTVLDLNTDLNNYTTEFDQVYGLCTSNNKKLSNELNSTKQLLSNRNDDLKQTKVIMNTIQSKITLSLSSNPDVINRLNDIKQLSSDKIDKIDNNNNDQLTLPECKNLLDDFKDDFKDNKKYANLGENSALNINDHLESANTELIELITLLRKY